MQVIAVELLLMSSWVISISSVVGTFFVGTFRGWRDGPEAKNMSLLLRTQVWFPKPICGGSQPLTPASGHWSPTCTCLNIHADTHRCTNKTETLAKKIPNTLELSFLPLFSVFFFWCECQVWLLLLLFWLFYQTTLKIADVNCSMVWMSLLQRDYANFMFATVLLFLPKHTLLCPPRLAILLPQLLYSLPCQFILASQNTERNWVDSSQGPTLMHPYRSFFFFF